MHAFAFAAMAAALVPALSLTGCSTQQVYASAQSLRENSCGSLTGRERDDCLAQARDPFRPYARTAPDRGG